MINDSNKNSSLSYTDDGIVKNFDMWVTGMDQSFQLSGQSQQSRTYKQFYPRANQVGPIIVTGRCPNEHHYLEMSKFIRDHQRALLSAPRQDRYARINPNAPGYQRLLRLSIPTENILVRGFISSFKVSRKGIFAVAPEFQFEFTEIFNTQSVNIGISNRVKKYYETGDYFWGAEVEREDIVSQKVKEVVDDVLDFGKDFVSDYKETIRRLIP